MATIVVDTASGCDVYALGDLDTPMLRIPGRSRRDLRRFEAVEEKLADGRRLVRTWDVERLREVSHALVLDS